uniref:Uncharacterized protein n=1 Tax=Romanomermis culicivorax TaxID=13658 RepID=A0A915K507_ROMCU
MRTNVPEETSGLRSYDVISWYKQKLNRRKEFSCVLRYYLVLIARKKILWKLIVVFKQCIEDYLAAKKFPVTTRLVATLYFKRQE